MTNTKTNTMTNTTTFKKHLPRTILETGDLWTCDHSDRVKLYHQKKTTTKIKTKKNTMTKTNKFREHLKRAIQDTCDL